MTADVVFLLDVDNTLLDGDRFIADLQDHLKKNFGAEGAQRYWAIFNSLREDLGYVDYLGALQALRRDLEHGSANEQRLMLVSSFLIDYPFADRLYANVLQVIMRLGRYGQTVILTDGDVVLQPRKVQRSGLWHAVDGRVLIYVHKEESLDAVQSHYPARHYVMVDDKLRILAAMKSIWLERLTTIFVRQGHYALDKTELAKYAAADLTIEHIGDLAELDIRSLIDRPAETARAIKESQ